MTGVAAAAAAAAARQSTRASTQLCMNECSACEMRFWWVRDTSGEICRDLRGLKVKDGAALAADHVTGGE